MKRGRLACAVAALALAAGCRGTTHGPAPGASGSPTISAEAPFGVAECDDYVAKYLACLEGSMPESARPAARDALQKTREAWHRAAQGPHAAEALKVGCTQAVEATRQAYARYGCTF